MVLLKPFIICGVSLWLSSLLLPAISFHSWWALCIAAIVLVIVQRLVKPVVHLFFLPITVVTLGFFSTFLNLALLWLVTAIVPGFHIDPMIILDHSFSQWMSLVIVSFTVSLLQMFLNRLW